MKGTMLVTTLVLTLPSLAMAHVSVRPRESRPGAEEQYTFRVPTEGAVATTHVVLEIPPDVTVLEVLSADGATVETGKRADRISDITWRKDIPPKQFAEFVFRARNPASGDIVWKAHQHFADGTVAAWIGPAGDRRPGGGLDWTGGRPATRGGDEADGRRRRGCSARNGRSGRDHRIAERTRHQQRLRSRDICRKRARDLPNSRQQFTSGGRSWPNPGGRPLWGHAAVGVFPQSGGIYRRSVPRPYLCANFRPGLGRSSSDVTCRRGRRWCAVFEPSSTRCEAFDSHCRRQNGCLACEKTCAVEFWPP